MKFQKYIKYLLDTLDVRISVCRIKVNIFAGELTDIPAKIYSLLESPRDMCMGVCACSVAGIKSSLRLAAGDGREHGEHTGWQ